MRTAWAGQDAVLWFIKAYNIDNAFRGYITNDRIVSTDNTMVRFRGMSLRCLAIE